METRQEFIKDVLSRVGLTRCSLNGSWITNVLIGINNDRHETGSGCADGVTAECAQRKPLRARGLHRGDAHWASPVWPRLRAADEDVRMLAVRLRAVFDALAPTLSAQPVAGAVAEPSVCGLTECKNRTKCDRCKAWDSMGI